MAKADIIPGQDLITITSLWSEKDQIKQIPGSRWRAEDKVWTVPLTWNACLQLRGTFGKMLEIGSGLHAWAVSKKADITSLMVLRSVVDRPLAYGDGWESKLYGFQRAGIDFMTTAGSCLLGDEMGTGKTIQALGTIRNLEESPDENGLPALIVCPNTLKGNWANEAAKWLPQATPYVIAGSAVKRRKTLAAALEDPSALVIINFESVRHHSRVAGFGSIALTDAEKAEKELNKFSFNVAIVDEAHRMKDPKSKQSRAVWAAVGDCPRRIAMTGTPIASGPENLWSVMHFVSPNEYPTKSKFVDRYCEVDFNGWAHVIGGLKSSTEDEFFGGFHPRFRRMPKALVLPMLPPKVFMRREVEMDPKQVKLYNEMAAGLVTRLPDGTLMVAKQDIAAQTRLLQFSSATMTKVGENKDGDPVYEMCDPAPKLEAMMEVIDEMGGKPIVIAFHHKQLLKLAEKRLEKAGIVFSSLTGDTPQWQRDLDVQKFQKGETPVFMFTIQAGGVGITLNRADTILFVQRSWSMVENAQATDRVHRIGSEVFQQVNVIDLVSTGSIEEHQIELVMEKERKAQQVMQDEKTLEMAGV